MFVVTKLCDHFLGRVGFCKVLFSSNKQTFFLLVILLYAADLYSVIFLVLVFVGCFFL